ncbi:hypothetical protein J6590_025885 [Homalodisca vitripennis]|nr:hypothetical protein J6590_025885 [Homalodisca vitripennis]
MFHVIEEVFRPHPAPCLVCLSPLVYPTTGSFWIEEPNRKREQLNAVGNVDHGSFKCLALNSLIIEHASTVGERVSVAELARHYSVR